MIDKIFNIFSQMHLTQIVATLIKKFACIFIKNV